MMFNLQFVRSHLIAAAVLAMLCSVGAAVRAGELSLSVKVVKQDIPVIVGEYVGGSVSLEVTVRNGSDEVQRIPTLAKAVRHGRLEAAIYDESGKRLSLSWLGVRQVLPPKALSDLKPGKQYRQIFPLIYFSYDNILTKGKYSIVVKFVASEKNTLTKTVHLEIVEVPKESVIHSIEIPQDRPEPGEANFIRKIQWDHRYFLYFMSYFEGKPVHARRLAKIPKNSDFVVAGISGTRRNLHVAFPNLESGLTILTINSIGGTVESSRKTEHPLKNWTDISGKNTVEARLVELKQGNVLLKKADGTVISLPLSQLSKANQEYVKKTFPETPPKKPTPRSQPRSD